MQVELDVIRLVAAALAVAALIAYISTPVVKNLAFKVGAVDVPKDNRRMHKHPIPRMGGLAIFLGFLLSVLIFLPLQEQDQPTLPDMDQLRMPVHVGHKEKVRVVNAFEVILPHGVLGLINHSCTSLQKDNYWLLLYWN